MPVTVLHVAGTDAERARRAVAEIRAESLAHNVFRGQVLSFGADVFGHAGMFVPGMAQLSFLRRPSLAADQLVLDPSTLAEVERQVVEVARHRDRLLAAGQHLKRGLLLFGPPGVGKTHTVRFLMSRLVGTTVVQLTGGALQYIAEAPSRGSRRACEA